MSDYGLTSWAQQFTDLDLPSGQKCQVKKIDLTDLIELGIVEQIDSLGFLVQQEHIERVKRPADYKKKKLTKAQEDEKENEQWQELVKDKDKFTVLASVLDKITCCMVIQPVVLNAYIENEIEEEYLDEKDNRKKTRKKIIRNKIKYEDRKIGCTYSDSVDFPDKMHLFSHAMKGVNQVKSFPEKSSEDLGDVADKSENGDTPE